MKKFSKQNLVFALLAIVFLFAYQNSNSQIKAVFDITGSVFDEATKQPAKVLIEVFDSTNKRIQKAKSNPSENGYYYISGLKPGNKYWFRLSTELGSNDKAYLTEKILRVFPNTNQYQQYSQDFLVKSLEVNSELKISIPPFEKGKSKLKTGVDISLGNIKNTLLENKRVKFEIKCFADEDNQSKYEKITNERCQAIKDYLVKNGISEDRITLKAVATTDPKNPPPTSKRTKGKKYIGSSYIVISSF